jgi:hypothetical protein
MNIFVLHYSTVDCAKYHCDQHVNKMILEYTQLLCTAMYLKGLWEEGMYYPTHHNHPCTQWLLKEGAHLVWLYRLIHQLHMERLKINPKAEEHKSLKVAAIAIANVLNNKQYMFLPDFLLIVDSPALAMPDECKTSFVIDSYIKYYKHKNKQWLEEKGKGMTWTNRPVPDFMME